MNANRTVVSTDKAPSAIGPYSADRALPQETLQAAESAEEVVNGESWIPLSEVALPFPEIKLNSTAASRFVHGQEVVVFTSGIEGLTQDSSVLVRGTDNCLLGIGSVRAVLARGRTLNIAPSMVLDAASTAAAGPK